MEILSEIVRRLLIQLPPEMAHEQALRLVGLAKSVGIPIGGKTVEKPFEIAGLKLLNPVGLAAGYDKNGEYVDALAVLGFGFIEVGTVTPRSQPGNPRPRMFRIKEKSALINRMGFNNKGVENLVHAVRGRKFTGPLGINIGKNATTAQDRAVDDYLSCLRAVYDSADYITINISSPNTVGLRNLQAASYLAPLLSSLANERTMLQGDSGRFVPIFVKVAPDCQDDEFGEMAKVISESGMDGVIATNTTVARAGVEGLLHGEEKGGLSGAPLAERAVEVVTLLRSQLPPGFPLIASGGVVSVEQALRLRAAGADAVQVYTGLVYKGPGLVADIANAW
ncbi:MAG: dihydroorotate dehydrogenase (quinone) [bacterium]|nr:dihydroorotate dehydrogenase (quinone) [bacterium]